MIVDMLTQSEFRTGIEELLADGEKTRTAICEDGEKTRDKLEVLHQSLETGFMQMVSALGNVAGQLENINVNLVDLLRRR